MKYKESYPKDGMCLGTLLTRFRTTGALKKYCKEHGVKLRTKVRGWK